MISSQALTPRIITTLNTIQDVFGVLAGRHRREEVLTAVRQIPAREAKFRPMPAGVTSALSEAYRVAPARR